MTQINIVFDYFSTVQRMTQLITENIFRSLFAENYSIAHIKFIEKEST